MSGATIAPREARERLYDVIRADVPFEQKAREALEIGAEYLGADNGHLARIDQNTDHWEAVVSTDSTGGRFHKGLKLDLGTTYCNRALESGSQLALYDAPDQGWEDEIAYETHGLNCYLGTHLVVDGETYGTVCFVADEPRDEPFSNDETMFAELISRLLERELERDQHEAAYRKQANLSTVLNRVLRHNLRNNMIVIRGRTQIMAEKLNGDGNGEIAIRNIDDLINLCEKARKLEQVIGETSTPQPTDLTELIKTVVSRVDRSHPDVSISVECPESITVSLYDSFERALMELVENAAEHSGDQSNVTVRVEHLEDTISISVTDTGPGLPLQEQKVLSEGTETPLIHGSGLGLWLVNWIVTNHEGSVEASVSEDGTTMTVFIPHVSTTQQQTCAPELMRSRDQYRAAFDAAHDAMVITDDEGRILDANDAAVDICGVAKQALLGRSIDEFYPEDFDFEAEWRAVQTGSKVRDTVTIVDVDGAEHSVEYAATPDVVPGQHLFVSRDITERQQREQELQEAKDRLEAIIAKVPTPILALDTEATVTQWNTAAEDVFGYTADEVLGKSIQELDLHTDDQEASFETKFKKLLAGEDVSETEVTRQTKRGDSVRLQLSPVLLRDETETPTGVMVIAEVLSD